MNKKEVPRTLVDLQHSAGDFLTTEQIGGFLGVKPKTVSKWCRDGRLPAVKLSNKAGWRVRVLDLAAWIEDVRGEALDEEAPTWIP